MDNSEIRRDRRSFMNIHHRPNNNNLIGGIVLKNRPARPAPEGGPDPGFWAVRGKKDDITAWKLKQNMKFFISLFNCFKIYDAPRKICCNKMKFIGVMYIPNYYIIPLIAVWLSIHSLLFKFTIFSLHIKCMVLKYTKKRGMTPFSVTHLKISFDLIELKSSFNTW